MCEKRYVFDAESSSKFSAADRCPAYKVPDDIVAAVRDKQRRDDIQTAELINRGTPAAPVKMGVDGGMNPTFLAAVKSHGGPGATIRTAIGTIPPHVNPPAESPASDSIISTMSLASAESKPAPAPRSSVQVASAGSSGGFFSNLFGSKSEDQGAARAPAAEPAKPKSAAAPAKPAPPRPPRRSPRRRRQKRRLRTRLQPNLHRAKAGSGRRAAGNTTTTSLLNGAAPTMPSNGFDSRFGALALRPTKSSAESVTQGSAERNSVRRFRDGR